MNDLHGFIKIHRKMLEWEWYSDPAVKSVFLHILLTASFKDTKWKGHEIKAGQLICSYSSLSEATGLSIKRVRTALKKLESTGEIIKKSANKFTLVTVANWEEYQLETEQGANKGQTKGKQRANKGQHRKNVKNVKNYIYEDVPSELESSFTEFAHMRERVKKPITSKMTVSRILNRLDKLADDYEEKRKILDQSTDHCWINVYELKDKPKKEAEIEWTMKK